MPINDFELYIFDWDGTLSTSTPLVKFSRFFKRRYNVKYVRSHPEYYKRSRNKKLVFKEEVNRSYAGLYDLYLTFAKPRLQIGAVDILRTLNEAGKQTAIFSDSKQYRLVKEIKLLGLSDYVDYVLSADTVKMYKPNPGGLELVAKKFGVSKKNCIYIGDMASDILTARFAGVSSCGVCNGVDSRDVLKKMDPNYLFSDLIKMNKEFWSIHD